MKKLWQQLSQRLTGGAPSSKPMTEYEEKALFTFGSAAVDGVKDVQSLGLTPIEPLTVEIAWSTIASFCNYAVPYQQPQISNKQQVHRLIYTPIALLEKPGCFNIAVITKFT
ncbi:PREDICTED: uncharacterized protein LOC108974438 [Bactrocera latifrons]|uniref:uncharacterized protein LOC108974438 n=1 Tax=Bactrocera latifrons TaxID=174628 RepID=UPI0008DDB34F|nr:PREDICTED: uncharacterized protein LOC108974438 [Bactrocera latifrons]